jgi:hypothetical protein
VTATRNQVANVRPPQQTRLGWKYSSDDQEQAQAFPSALHSTACPAGLIVALAFLKHGTIGFLHPVCGLFYAARVLVRLGQLGKGQPHFEFGSYELNRKLLRLLS